MRKTAIALCLEEEVYKERFERCWMHHYRHQYDLYLFSEIQELLQTDGKEYEVIITDIGRAADLEELKKQRRIIIFLWEKESDLADLEAVEGIIFTAKFQEVYKIEEKVKGQIKLNERSNEGKGHNSKNCKVVGIFSLDCESMQMPFAALAACEYGEKMDTLLINLQSYSGFEMNTEDARVDFLGIEDLMTMSTTDAYSKRRLYGAIGHEQNWDYIYPARNVELLSEGNHKLYQKIMEIMVKEFNYEIIIINFGTIFSGMSTVFEQCDEFYLLVSKKDSISWREKDFRKELERKEKTVFTQQIKRIEIPSIYWGDGRDWKRLMQQWRWSGIGDQLRKYIWAGV